MSRPRVHPARPLSSRYGAPLWQLVLHVAAFGLSVYAFSKIFAGGHVVNYLAWFLVAVVLHDLVLLPLYSLLDRTFGWALVPAGLRGELVNHVRIPALIAGLLLLVYFPLILGLSSRTYNNASGHPPSGYLRNWLLVTVALFVISGALYALRRIRGR